MLGCNDAVKLNLEIQWPHTTEVYFLPVKGHVIVSDSDPGFFHLENHTWFLSLLYQGKERMEKTY